MKMACCAHVWICHANLTPSNKSNKTDFNVIIDRGLNNISYWIFLSPIRKNIKSRLQYWARPKVEPSIEVENIEQNNSIITKSCL